MKTEKECAAEALCVSTDRFLNVQQYFLNMVFDLQIETFEKSKVCFPFRCTKVIDL